MPLTDKLKKGWTAPPIQAPAATTEAPAATTGGGATTGGTTGGTTTAAAPAAPPAAPPQDNSATGYLHWLATASPMANFQRAFEDRFTRGGLDTLFSYLPSPAKGNMSTADFLAQERAKTQAAKDNLGPAGRIAADVTGTAMSAPLFRAAGVNNPIVQGLISGGLSGLGHGGDLKDVLTQTGEEGLFGALSIPVSKYVVNPLVKAVRNTVGSGPPSSTVYPYVKPGQTDQGGTPAQSPTLGGVPGFRDPTYPANMTAQDIGRLAREMEGMPPAGGEDADAKNALMNIMKKRINTVAEQGTPTGGTPGSGQAAANEAYWEAGGPPNAPPGAESLTPIQRGVARVVGGATGGAAGSMLDVPGAREGGAFMGAQVMPEALARVLNRTPVSAYPAFSTRPPTALQATSNLLAGGAQDYSQWLMQQLGQQQQPQGQ